MGASVRPHSNDNPFAQPAGVALEDKNPSAPKPQERHYSPDNPFAAQGETYSPDNPFASSTIRHEPVVVTPPSLPPAVVSDTAPGPITLPPAVVTSPPPKPKPYTPPPPVPAAQPDVARVGPPPGSQGVPLEKSDFLTRVAGALIGPVVDPVGVAKGMGNAVLTANRAAAENEAAAAVGLAGGDQNVVERTVTPEQAKNAAITTATLLAAPLAGEAEALLGSKLAPAVGSRLAGAVARTVVPATIGAGLMPQDPFVGATAGGIAGAAHNEISGEPFRPTVRRAITSEPSAMLPATTTPRAPTARVIAVDVAPEVAAPRGADYHVEDLGEPPTTTAEKLAPNEPTPANGKPAWAQSLDEFTQSGRSKAEWVASINRALDRGDAVPPENLHQWQTTGLEIAEQDARAKAAADEEAKARANVEAARSEPFPHEVEAAKQGLETTGFATQNGPATVEVPPGQKIAGADNTVSVMKRAIDQVGRDEFRKAADAEIERRGVRGDADGEKAAVEETARKIVAQADEAAATKPTTGDVIFEDGEKRFVEARTKTGVRRPVGKVSTDGLVAEMNDVMRRRDDAVRRSQYNNTLDESAHTKNVGDRVITATRIGKGPSEQAKAFTNIEDANRIIGEIDTELKRRGLSDEEIADRAFAAHDLSEERAALNEDVPTGRRTADVVTDEQGNVLFSPKKPTVAKPTGETDLFGRAVTEEVPAQTSMFDENAGTKLAQEDAAKLAKHNESIAPEEMARRRDDLGAPKQEIPGAEEPDQGMLFDRAGAAPVEQGELPLDEPVDFAKAQPRTAAPSPKGGVAFTLRQISQRLAKALTLPIRERYFPFAQFRARGVYKVQPEVARVMDLQDLDVAAHEAGHHIGKQYLGGLDDKETKKLLAGHPGVEGDLRRLGEDLYGPKAVDKHLQEGIAELFKWYVIDPTHLQKRAPNALRWLENDIFPQEREIAKAFEQARGDFELYQRSTADQKLSALYAKQKPERSIADLYDAAKRFLRAKFTDDLGEFQQLAREGAIPKRAQDDPYLLAMATRTDGAWVLNALNYGIPNATGRRVTVSYKSLLDRVPKGKATEYKNYLIAERLNEQASHAIHVMGPDGQPRRLADILTEAPGKLADPATMRRLDDVVKRLTGGLESNPQGGSGKVVRAQLTYKDVQDVVERGRKDAKLQAWAEDYWQFNHATLRLLEGHVLTGDEVARILDANEKYVDFHRIFDEETGTTVGGAGRAFPRNSSGVARLRGSSRSIGDPLESPVLSLYKAARMVHKHAAFEAMVRLANRTEGLGSLLERVHAPTDAIKVKITPEVADQLKALGLDEDDVDAIQGATLVQWVARQYATGRDTRNMVLPSLIGGKRQWFKVGDKRLWDAVQNMGAEEVPEWLRWLELPARMLRAGTTLVPGFSVGTNWFRDAFDAATYSKGGTRPPFYHFIRGLFHMARRDDMFHLFELEGGDVSAQMLHDRQQLPSRLRDLSRNKALAGTTTVVRTPADWARALSVLSRRFLFESWLRPLEHLASIPERATRIGETALVYKKLLAEAKAKASGQPLTPQDKIDIRKRAGAAGREVTLNFARGGTWVRQLNRLSVFLKPSVESAARFGRESRSRPFTIFARMAAWIGIPAMVAYLMQRKDKDYQATPSWMKNTGLVFIEHNDDGTFKRRWYFPIPNLEGWLFSVVPTRVMEWMDTKNPGALDQIGDAFMQTVKPSFTPTFMVPLIENTRNRAYFGDRPIEPSGLEELEPGYRATPETGETARLIGKATNTSPAKIENVVRGYTGGLGMGALAAADKAVHATKGALGKQEEVNSLRDMDALHTAPVVGRFARGQGNAMSSEWVQQFYDTWTRNNQYRSTLIYLRKQGRDDEADQYLEQHRADIATVATAEELHPHLTGAKPGPLREAHDALAKLRQRMDMLSRDKLSPEEYRAQVGEVNEQMLMVARRALDAAGVKVMPAGSPEP